MSHRVMNYPHAAGNFVNYFLSSHNCFLCQPIKLCVGQSLNLIDNNKIFVEIISLVLLVSNKTSHTLGTLFSRDML